MKTSSFVKIWKKLKPAEKKTDDNIVTGNDYFISLIQLAIENNDDVSEIIKGLLLKEKNERMVLLTMIINDFEKNKVNPEFIKALRYLYYDDIVRIIKDVLKRNPIV